MPTVQPPLGVFPIHGGYLDWNAEIAKTTAYQVTLADAGTCFTNRGATGSVTFTLPAIGPNLRYCFRVVANQNVLVTSKEGGNVVAFNNAAASTLAFQTGGALIGGCLIVNSSADGTLWYVEIDSAGANTVTVT